MTADGWRARKADILASAEPPLVAHVTADRGYLNFTLDARALARQAAAACFAAPGLRAAAPRRIAVDFSSPNIAKEMHVGHLRSTIIGETICRVLASCGHSVQRINHVGDWGTQFGMLLCHLFDVFPDFTTTPPDISDLNVFYKEAKKRFDAEPAFKVRSQEMVPELQGGGNARATAGWQALYEVSKLQFSQVYERLDVTNEIVGESFYQPLLPPVVDELRAKGLIVEDLNEKTGKTALVAWVKDAIQWYTGCSLRFHILMRLSHVSFSYIEAKLNSIVVSITFSWPFKSSGSLSSVALCVNA